MAKTALPIASTGDRPAERATDGWRYDDMPEDGQAWRDWHGLNAGHVWSLWTRYACTAFYAHPSAWDEIGFPGAAYPQLPNPAPTIMAVAARAAARLAAGGR